MVDLTIRGNGTSRNRMITEQTLDREGFCLPEPPQRCNRRVKSAVGIGRREQNNTPFGDRPSTVNRPKSARYSFSKRQEPTHGSGCVKDKIEDEIGENDTENQKEINHGNFIKAKKMTVNQKWLYQGEKRKWKPRNSQVRENPPSRLNHDSKSKDKDIKQRISVCEVMAKMQRSNSPDHSNGASAPPTSPKISTSAIIGKKFVDDSPHSAPASGNRPNVNYLQYAKSKHRVSPDKAIARKSVSFLQEDMTVTSQPSGQRDIIQIPTNGIEMFSTDEPDEESEVVVDSNGGRQTTSVTQPIREQYSSHVIRTDQSERSIATSSPARRTQNKIYRSIYLNNYRENNFPRDSDSGRLERPKSTNHVRYCPNTYRFHDQQYTRDFVQHAAWDRVQPRLPVGNSRAVSSRRPSNSLYVGTS